MIVTLCIQGSFTPKNGWFKPKGTTYIEWYRVLGDLKVDVNDQFLEKE